VDMVALYHAGVERAKAALTGVEVEKINLADASFVVAGVHARAGLAGAVALTKRWVAESKGRRGSTRRWRCPPRNRRRVISRG
jgi:hypothetical protein